MGPFELPSDDYPKFWVEMASYFGTHFDANVAQQFIDHNRVRFSNPAEGLSKTLIFETEHDMVAFRLKWA